jgi:DNA-directed RNA polymerase specialized sigma24 family protein
VAGSDAPGLSREAFEQLLAALDPVRERAGQRYEGIRARLRRFFMARGMPEPEDLADQTIDRVARKLSEGEIIRTPDLIRYFLGVARNVALQAWSLEQRRRESPRSWEEAISTPSEDDAQEAATLACLERCLEALPPESRTLALHYYDHDPAEKVERRRDLARQLSVGSNALRIRLHRLRAQLAACTRRCLEKGREGGQPS